MLNRVKIVNGGLCSLGGSMLEYSFTRLQLKCDTLE